MSKKEYIERDAAIEAFDDPRVERNYGDVSPESVIRVIDAIPAADVVPVVRCRECEHGEYDDAIEDEYCYHCRYDGFSYNKADHFCSDGERKGGDE